MLRLLLKEYGIKLTQIRIIRSLTIFKKPMQGEAKFIPFANIVILNYLWTLWILTSSLGAGA